MDSSNGIAGISKLAEQLRLEMDIVYDELYWALGEERINRVTPSIEEFRAFQRCTDGLTQFWGYANNRLAFALGVEEARDIWECIDLTLNARKRRQLTFQDYLLIAARSEQRCEICGSHPPDVKLEIDHILPVSRGGANVGFNLRFLCQRHNRSRGNRFRWADLWRRAI